jgi:hypothetical protein
MDKGTWLKLTRSQQLGNIGSEIARARHWSVHNDDVNRKKALERALELLDLTLDDRRWGYGIKEIARFREIVSAWFCDETFFDVRPEDLENYCVDFVIGQERAR